MLARNDQHVFNGFSEVRAVKDLVLEFGYKIVEITTSAIGIFIAVMLMFFLEGCSGTPFIGIKGDITHHKHQHEACYQGGLTNHATVKGSFLVGVESNDLVAYGYYQNERCPMDGKQKDQSKKNQNNEGIGASLMWKTNF